MYILQVKPIIFLGHSLRAIREFPATVRKEVGYELDKVQRGINPKDWKTMPKVAPGVREIRVQIQGAWRVVYVANRKDALYVLHAFQKKTQTTSKRDIALIKSNFRKLK